MVSVKMGKMIETQELAETLKCVRNADERGIRWGASGKLGGIHCWCSTKLNIGGIEIHSKVPFSHSRTKPDNAECWLLDNQPCWHDGSSLWWIETGRFLVSDCILDRDDTPIFQTLRDWYCSKFGAKTHVALSL